MDADTFDEYFDPRGTGLSFITIVSFVYYFDVDDSVMHVDLVLLTAVSLMSSMLRASLVKSSPEHERDTVLFSISRIASAAFVQGKSSLTSALGVK